MPIQAQADAYGEGRTDLVEVPNITLTDVKGSKYLEYSDVECELTILELERRSSNSMVMRGGRSRATRLMCVVIGPRLLPRLPAEAHQSTLAARYAHPSN